MPISLRFLDKWGHYHRFPPQMNCGEGLTAYKAAVGRAVDGYDCIVRTSLKFSDRRIARPASWGSPLRLRRYGSRATFERINSRFPRSCGFERLAFVAGRKWPCAAGLRWPL